MLIENTVLITVLSAFVCINHRCILIDRSHPQKDRLQTPQKASSPPGHPASDHRTLVVLDEFPQMRRMKSMEKAVGGLAEYGVRLFIVIQSLVQLQAAYPKTWELFLSNADLQIYFGTNSIPTAEYVTKRLGEREIVKHAQSVGFNENVNSNASTMVGTADATTEGTGHTATEGGNNSTSVAEGTTSNKSTTKSRGYTHKESPTYYAGLGGLPFLQGAQINRGKQKSNSKGESLTKTTGDGTNWSTANTTNNSTTHTEQTSETDGTGEGRGVSLSVQQQFHKVPVLSPAALIKAVAKVVDEDDLRFPGQALIVLDGGRHSLVRTLKYYEDEAFYRCFGAHPRYEFKQAPECYSARNK